MNNVYTLFITLITMQHALFVTGTLILPIHNSPISIYY